MDMSKISAGRDLPHDFNCVIEIPAQSDPVKYEVDKESGALLVDRFIPPTTVSFLRHSAMTETRLTSALSLRSLFLPVPSFAAVRSACC